MLELKGQILRELVELALRGEVLDRRIDETLRHLERRLDLDARGGAGVKIDTAAAATPARRLINATATRSWVRTGRSYQSFCST